MAHRAKILVIDNERLSIQLLFEGLNDEYSILAASNGVSGLQIAREQKPDLILLDIVLGDLSGYEICKALKQDPATSNIPIIFVTGQDSAEDELAGLELGAVDYFKKPFSLPLARVRVRKQIELKQKTDLLEQLSFVDSLTGIANKRQFDEKIEKAIRYAARNHRGLSLLMIDIGSFKTYSEQHGQFVGDLALKKVASILQRGAARPLDFVARYGGEAFAVLLIDSGPEESKLLAEKLRSSIECANIAYENSDKKYLSVSIGVSHVDAHHAIDIKVNDIIKEVNNCLYAAKLAGTNKVICSHQFID